MTRLQSHVADEATRPTPVAVAGLATVLDMAANQTQLGQKVAELLQPIFKDLGLALDSFIVENRSPLFRIVLQPDHANIKGPGFAGALFV